MTTIDKLVRLAHGDVDLVMRAIRAVARPPTCAADLSDVVRKIVADRR